MSDHDRHPHIVSSDTQAVHDRLCGVEDRLEEVKDAMARAFAGGEVQRFTFLGKEGITSLLDDKGSNALSYAVYNPNNFRVFVGLGGASADASSGLIIPKQKLVVAPIQVNGHVALAADATELAEATGSIIRVRFPTPQAFFVGALA